MSGRPDVIGVLGAGTMGAGIAQLAALAGARTLVHDPDAGALERGLEGIRRQLARGAERGRYEPGAAEAAAGRLEAVDALEALADCGLVIEAAPERMEIKEELFGRLAEIVAADAVLASNTSSIPITAIAAAVPHPERVVGMHFFNPAPVMKLLEVVAGEESSEAALAVARATGEAMEREVIDALDGPGFLVNRCNRPFGLEGMRIVQERLARLEQVDRICRMAGGFRMGPFELSDLVGVDTGFAVSESFARLSYGEPRWRPSLLQARMVAAGRHGRKTGKGWYEYAQDGSYRAEDPEPPAAGGGEGRLLIVAGTLPLASELLAAGADAGWDARTPEDAEGEVPAVIVDCGADPEGPPLQGGPQLVLCAEGSLAALDLGGSAAGFHALPPLAEARLVELTRGPETSEAAVEAAEALFASLGKLTEWVGDGPGLVLGRIVCQVVNECAFALGEGVGTAPDIDTGMRLGMNYPRGPLAWADAIGLDHVLGVLDGLWEEYREERYRPAPEIRRRVLTGRLGAATGAGFLTD
jgi:3-hydroxybutyryl-CoA dehydrogenase